jgi:small subunit ribosomal protein S20
VARHKSAEKRARQSKKREVRNVAAKHRVRYLVRAFREALDAGDNEKAKSALGAASQELQKAASKGVLRPRNASRRVSRMAVALNAKAK